MYKTKPRFRCSMPSDAPLNVLALNASLKHEPTLSNTGELASLVLDEMHALAPITVKAVRLADARLPVGLRFREAAEDDWPDLLTQPRRIDSPPPSISRASKQMATPSSPDGRLRARR